MPGPMFWNSDLSAMKTFKLTERQGLQFRFAAFNFLNHSLLSFDNGDTNLKLIYNNLNQLITGTTCPSDAKGVSCAQQTTFGNATHHFGRRILELGVKYSF